MRTLIFILIFLFSSTAIAGESSFQNGKYYGYHKNDKCVFEKGDYPTGGETKPDFCVFTETRGCCAWYSDIFEQHQVFCYEYKSGLWQGCVWSFDRFED